MENKPMEHQTKSFLRGTLPSWFNGLCLAVLVFMCQRAISEFDDLRKYQRETRERLITVEAQIRAIETGFSDIKQGQRDMIREFKNVSKNP